MKKKNDQQIPPVLSPRISAMLGKLPRRLLTANLIAIAVILAAIVAIAVLMPYPHGHGETIAFHLLSH